MLKEKCRVVKHKGKGKLFTNIVVCEEEWTDPNEGDESAEEKVKEVRKDDDDKEEEAKAEVKSVLFKFPGKMAEEEEQKLPSFIQDIVDVLSVLRFGSNDFLEYVQNTDFLNEFDDGKKSLTNSGAYLEIC